MSKAEYYSEADHGPHEIIELSNYQLESGVTLPNARIAYKTHGKLNAAKDNVVLFRTCGPEHRRRWRCSSARMARSTQGNTSSSCQASSPTAFRRRQVTRRRRSTGVPSRMSPLVTMSWAQHRLITERYGIERLELVLGWSMGAEQTYEWAVRFPDMVKRALPFAGQPRPRRTTIFSFRSHEDTLEIRSCMGQWILQASVRRACRPTTARADLVGDGSLPGFYNKEAWREVGFTSLEKLLHRFWEAYFASMDPNNLIWMGWKWRHGDVSLHTGGDLAAALGRIKAKTYVVPFSRDMFFPPADCEAEQKLIPNSKFRVVDSLSAVGGR